MNMTHQTDAAAIRPRRCATRTHEGLLMSDLRQFGAKGTVQRSAAKFLGLLLGIGVAVAWPRGAHAGDAACRGDSGRLDISCQAPAGSLLLSFSDDTKMIAPETL